MTHRLIQQALLERKQFEEKQQQLAALHLRQQQELQKRQQLLRQMQEAQLVNLQRQILYQNVASQQQRVSSFLSLAHTHANTHTHAQYPPPTHTDTHANAQTYTHTRTQTRAHAHTHIHTHTRTHSLSRPKHRPSKPNTSINLSSTVSRKTQTLPIQNLFSLPPTVAVARQIWAGLRLWTASIGVQVSLLRLL